MSYVNINTQEIKIPSRVGSTNNVTWANSQALLRSLGWRIAPELPPVADGFARGIVVYIEGDGTTAQALYQDRALADIEAEELARPFAISKVKVLMGFLALSPESLQAFVDYLNADATRRLMWDASVNIDSDNPMVVGALPAISQLIGSDAMTFLRNCKSEIS